jgi:hypothetical protein
MSVMNLVTTKAAAKLELLFKKPASDELWPEGQHVEQKLKRTAALFETRFISVNAI